MYAAAGGASLASRQKRKNQAAQNVKNKALLQQGLKDKLAATRASNLAPSKAQSRPFHNLPSTYLRAPQAHLPPVRKLSAGYTTQNKILVPINESNNQYFSHFHPHTHSTSNTPSHHLHHHHHHFHEHDHEHTSTSSTTHEHHHHQHHHDPQAHHHFRAVTPRPTTAHDPSINVHHRLTKSATASIPLVSQYSDITPPDSPSCLLKPPPTQESYIATIGSGVAAAATAAATATATESQEQAQIQTHVPYFVIPATPATSPGPPNTDQLERKCSIYRGKQFEFDDTFQKHEADYADEYYVKHAIKPHHTTTTTATAASVVPVVERWTDSECCDSDHQNSVCTCDHIEVK